MKSDKKHGIGLIYALRGFRLACSQRNFKIQLLIAALVVLAAVFLKVSTIEWCILLICISGVLSFELINTAIESVVDKISPEYSIFAKQTKDISAGAVFVVAIISAMVGLIIFIPKFIQLYDDFNR